MTSAAKEQNVVENPRWIRLTFASIAEPGTPLTLDKDATDKLSNIPKLLRALADCYGARLGSPILWGGDISIEVFNDPNLFGDRMATDLELTAQELHENARCQPPLPLGQVITHRHCVDLLRALAQAYSKSKLTASLHIADKILELPHVPLADFTEPENRQRILRQLRANVIGVCVPKLANNAVILEDMSMLELPIDHYSYSIDQLFEHVVKSDAVYVGPAEFARKGVYRALPGGELKSQIPANFHD